MFRKKKKCPKCGYEVDEKWEFCPMCGYPLKEKYREERFFEDIFDFDSITRRIEKEFEEFDKLFKMDFKPLKFKIPESGVSGISITIHSGTGMKPRIEVKTYGNMKKYEPEIKRKLGLAETEKVKEIETTEEYTPPKITEEPEAKIKNLGEKFVVEIDLPEVEKEEDIKIQALEQSLEIRARAKDKLYFKLLPITGRVVKKEFKNGKLILEIERG